MKFAEDYFEDDQARAWYTNMVQHVLDHAPACLGGFETKRVPLADDTWDGRVEWKIACPCGSDSGKILGYSLAGLQPSYDGPTVFVTPLAFQCSACEQVIEIIDTDKHGYDGELGHGAATIRGEGARTTFACQSCQHTTFRLVTCFQHSQFDIIEDEPELEPVAQNYFDWFECQASCMNCGTEQSVGDYELA
ncbi:hypothetical protein GC197_10555 [bacterium]|nr:hypothetical protein [bacterium]